MSRDISMGASSSWFDRGWTYSRDQSMGIAVSGDPSNSQFSRPLRGGFSKERSSNCFRAPTGDTDTDDEDDLTTPAFSIRAPDDDSDSDAGEVTSQPAKRRAEFIKPLSPAEEALNRLRRAQHEEVLARVTKKSLAFQEALWRIDQEHARKHAEVDELMKRKQAEFMESLAARSARLSKAQEEVLTGLQLEHSSQAEAMSQQAQAARLAEERKQRLLLEERKREAAALKRAEQEAAERDQRAREEAEKQAAEQAMAGKAVAERKAQEQADADRLKLSATASTSASTTPGVCLSAEAAAFEKCCREALCKAQDVAKQLDEKGAKASGKRQIHRNVNVLVNQIGNTQQQVNAATAKILELLNGLHGPQKAFALLSLANMFIDLSEGAGSRFPVAEVAVAVCKYHPEADLILLGKLQEVCPLAVPKCILRLSNESLDNYYGRWGFRKVEFFDEKTKEQKEEWEDVDVFLNRVTAHVQFLAAFTQSDNQTQHATERGWSYLARFLNALPPNRYTAFALMAFVDIAGFKMHNAYRGQFIKLLTYIDQNFVEVIIQKGMEEARSAVLRLRQYLQRQEFLQEPGGRKLAMYDDSYYERA